MIILELQNTVRPYQTKIFHFSRLSYHFPYKKLSDKLSWSLQTELYFKTEE